jgi:DNA/RNA-binding domain of Phe-tRNA-synthetase-like protein
MSIIKVHESVFQRYPTFRRGVVIATGMQNRGPDPGLESLLQEVRQELVQFPIDLANDSRIAVWMEANRRHSNSCHFSPAHVGLRRRAQLLGMVGPFINKAVAVMAFCSIQELVPVGGDDLACVLRFGQHLELGPATGHETFVPFGKPEQQERPEPGEIVLAVNGTVCCRHWCWQNGHPTRITEETTALALNIDGLGPNSEARAISVRDRVALLLRRHCQAQTATGILSPRSPAIAVNL